MEIDYSVIIRTTGEAGEKYRKLLNSINNLEPKPKEILVVLPNGYDLPPERLGWERFCFSPKGMVIQRITGVQLCHSRYALICDDDVCFDFDFVQKLYTPICNGEGQFSIGPLYSFLPTLGAHAIIDMISAHATPMLLCRQKRYISVLKSSGYAYNRHLKLGKYYETQSAPWTCFFADINVLRAIDFADEAWLDAHGYSAMDDQTMFYKAWLRGYKTIVVSDAVYEHLDGKTSTRNNKPTVLYCSMFNRLVFWHRFIYQQGNKPLAVLCYANWLIWELILDLLRIFRRKMDFEDVKMCWKGWTDGYKYLKSEEYRLLPRVE